MNIIRHNPAPAQPTRTFLLETRDEGPNGVERRTDVQPAGTTIDAAWQVMAAKVAANPAEYGPHTGRRLVLIGGGR